MNRLLISAAHKSSGKTTFTLGLCRALRQRGQIVQPFKKGPDYIDPMWLGLASDRPCHNLDFYLMGRDEILASFHERIQGADIAIIEGNKGLYDGLDLDGSNSNAALASLLRTPVLLVIDARGMTRGIAPLILGYQSFDPDIEIAGVILNQLGGSRHETKLRAVIEHYTDVPVLGALHHDDHYMIVERHLGLTPSNEADEAANRIKQIAHMVSDNVDIDRILSIANKAKPLTLFHTPSRTDPPPPLTRGGRSTVRIGIAQDAAFGFYYPGDLEAFDRIGAEIVLFNTMKDEKLPEIDGLFIGGGFPEMKMHALEANSILRHQLLEAINRGLPVYAECGGLMYLTRNLSYQGNRCEMVGALAADTVMHARPQGRGYVALQETGHGLWSPPADTFNDGILRAHEFHYSSLVNVADDLRYAYKVLRGHGVDGQYDGIVHKNVLACYCHLRDLEKSRWVGRFVQFVREMKQQNRHLSLVKP